MRNYTQVLSRRSIHWGTLCAWREKVARMFRYSKNNGITEGFHRKMKLIQRRVYGFKNFENYRSRLKTLKGKSPYDFIKAVWITDPERFINNPDHFNVGPNIRRCGCELSG